MTIEKISGLIAAPFTPFKEDGALNCDLIPAQAAALIADGVTGAYICGTTGEGISCSVAERIAVMEAWQAAAGGKLRLMAHTGAASLTDIATLNRKAAELGYSAISVTPTTFFRPANEAALVEYCAAAARAGNPELPFYYYHTMNARLELSMPRFLELADGRIPQLAGIKFNHHTLYEYQNCLAACGGRYDILYGVDEFFAPALLAGAGGFIGSTYNYSAPLYFEIIRAVKRSDYARVRALMRKVCRGVDLLNAWGGLPAGKAMMRLRGIECGPARLPLRQLSPEERDLIARSMRDILTEPLD